jgi:phosphoenolpyruvate carboxykinase (ATP)
MTNETFPLSVPATVHHNQPIVALVEETISRGEAHFASTGALVVETGAHTGRSAQDKFTIRDDATEATVWWDNNKPITRQQFDLLLGDFKAHAAKRELFVQYLFAGADARHRLNARIFT